ncbi:cysteine hydrolase family protein [Roseibium sp. RKSG952]|uniref:cysteine hydrolase family protein n=1 Tax=Roseibium sp. RKSG952 TaxID=2529384 RepID=UPI0018AD230E|nr:isochorismatase family protein [Roseibium sp. RKSG952]
MIWWIVGLSVLACVAAALGYCACVFRRLETPTKGKLINSQERGARALLVIDVQEDFTRNNGKRAFDPEMRDTALDIMRLEIAQARASGDEVIFIKNIFRDRPVIWAMKLAADGIGTPGREGLRIDRSLDTAEARVFEKAVGDTFSNTAFETYLTERNIGHLRLVGLDACYCVQLTAKGALNRGFSVEIVEAGLITGTPEKWPDIRSELQGLGARLSERTQKAA